MEAGEQEWGHQPWQKYTLTHLFSHRFFFISPIKSIKPSPSLLVLSKNLVGIAHFPLKRRIQRPNLKLFYSASKMGSGDWLKNIISLNKARKQKSNKIKGSPLSETNGFILKPQPQKEYSRNIVNNATNGHHEVVGRADEGIAATRIQTAFRAFMARKAFRRSKGIVRFQTLTKGDFGQRQTSNTLKHLQTWSRIQAKIRARRLGMVEEGGIKQKKLENQLKLDTKRRGLEVEWSGGGHTMVEALARVKHREEAAAKRERAMAYAFSHQWRANSRSNLGPNDSDLTTANWDWSWVERWVVARPWESRALVGSTPKKVDSPPKKKSNSLKTSPNGKKTTRNWRLSYGDSNKVEDAKRKSEKYAR